MKAIQNYNLRLKQERNEYYRFLINEYNLETIEEYFDMIFESYLNGQRKQSAEQYQELTLNGRIECLTYLKETTSPQEMVKFMASVLTRDVVE